MLFDVQVMVEVQVEASNKEEAEQLANDWCGVSQGAPSEIEFISVQVQNSWDCEEDEE